ncbi:hypothetical protein [Sphingorhabdus sp. Alg239-R122]|uniref:hypothetical protein n=1 Tax=Sphingorhabdus sp. Alg239-R122 TaxID=2305989 RepID=UPI0013DBB03D|nr:hypothetical protein [Sphingorhabdus sp. Alg239-R122]
MLKKTGIVAGALAATLVVAPVAQAEVIEKSENGFVVRHKAHVKASPDDVFKMLRSPAKWWSAQHSWTGDADNFYMDAQAGGCFCELIPAAKEGDKRGSAEHMRIIYAQPGKMLRLSGALGPLQSEALSGTLTIAIKANEDATTTIGFEYVVGGFMRFKMDQIAPAVDQVIGEQISRLSMQLGPLPKKGSGGKAGNSEDESAKADKGASAEDEEAPAKKDKSSFEKEFGDGAKDGGR